MGKIKDFLAGLSLRKTFLLYLVTFMLAAAFLSSVFLHTYDNAKAAIFFRYYENLQLYDVEAYSISLILDGSVQYLYDPVDRFLWQAFDVLSQLTVPLIFSGCTLIACLLFYRNRLKKPLAALDEASQRVLANDLNFSVGYASNDEIGRLCATYEKMRISLLDSNRELWRALEERKRLNASFSHDLRTPLTVLRGYADLLEKYVPQDKLQKEKLISTISTMSGQITRLENYVTSMNALQKLDDIVIHPQNTETEPMLQEFREITSFLCDQYHLSYTVEGSLPSQLWVDGEIILQVFENLVSNAARYAKERITVLCTCKDTHFVIDVMDDGTGFSEKDLLFATRPYYGSDKNGQEGHFGLGLNICKILCEKHGGSITLGNNIGGGAHVAAEFLCIPQ